MNKCPLKSLNLAIACHSRDWSVHYMDAWIYGIICGWDESIDEIAKMHKWSSDTVERLKTLHTRFKELEKEHQ